MKKTTLILLALAAFAGFNLHAQKFPGLALTPPMGWNSWNKFAGNINEELIRETADAMATNGMLAAGYNYIVVDDCWEAMDRDKLGNIVADPKKFPSGMKALGDYLHAKGFKFGIHNCAGTKTCAGFPGARGTSYGTHYVTAYARRGSSHAHRHPPGCNRVDDSSLAVFFKAAKQDK